MKKESLIHINSLFFTDRSAAIFSFLLDKAFSTSSEIISTCEICFSGNHCFNIIKKKISVKINSNSLVGHTLCTETHKRLLLGPRRNKF